MITDYYYSETSKYSHIRSQQEKHVKSDRLIVKLK